MKQMKKKSQKSDKKQPINVQLSKRDLMELLTVVKDFIQEELRTNVREQVLAELSRQSQRVYLNSSENAKRIAEIEAREEKNAVTLNDRLRDLSGKNATLVFQIQCGARTGHHFSVEYTNNCRTSFRCIKCELSYGKDNCDLNKKERALLKTV